MYGPDFVQGVLDRIKMNNESAVRAFRIEVGDYPATPASPGVRANAEQYTVSIKDKDGDELYFYSLHRIEGEDFPHWNPDLGPSWFLQDDADTGIWFESRKFAMHCLMTWVDNALDYLEHKGT